MPLTGPPPEGDTFFCPHCGALYSVTQSRLSKSDSNIAKNGVASNHFVALHGRWQRAFRRLAAAHGRRYRSAQSFIDATTGLSAIKLFSRLCR